MKVLTCCTFKHVYFVVIDVSLMDLLKDLMGFEAVKFTEFSFCKN